jgi:drug/metabolite transporter (DMT)-like permease
LAAVLFLAVPALFEGVLAAVPKLDISTWLAIAFIGMGSAAGYWLWLWSLARAGATRVTVFVALSPITAAGLGIVLLQERVSAPLIAGTICVVAGLWLAHRAAPAAPLPR